MVGVAAVVVVDNAAVVGVAAVDDAAAARWEVTLAARAEGVVVDGAATAGWARWECRLVGPAVGVGWAAAEDVEGTDADSCVAWRSSVFPFIHSSTTVLFRLLASSHAF